MLLFFTVLVGFHAMFAMYRSSLFGGNELEQCLLGHLRRIHLNRTEANTGTVRCAGIVLRSDTGAGKSYDYGYFSA